MKALVTGASSGIGRDFARILASRGYDLILVARNLEELKKVKEELKVEVRLIDLDLAKKENCFELFKQVENEHIDILINNAGFGVFGDFLNTDLDKELQMIATNIEAVHILTKLFYKKFDKENSGYILNVASSAAFQPGPLMASYYASKSYVYNLTCALYEEIRHNKSNVKVCVLCPGPVETNFNNVAGVKFGIKALKSYDVAKYAIEKMFKKRLVIIPGFTIKCAYWFGRFIPVKSIMKIAYKIQSKKVI